MFGVRLWGTSMDTKQFLDEVLPVSGYRCVGVLQDGQFTNYFGASNEWAADAAVRIDARDCEAYFGCASFKTRSSRKAENVEAARAFWIDIDTQEGKPKEKYATRKEALKELLAFCSDLGLASPLVVSSGYGLHAYWRCDADITPEAWKATAELLKKATKSWGLAVDPSRTSDIASVLRPIGVRNHKRGAKKDVKLVMPGELTTRDDVHAALVVHLGEDTTLPNGNAPTTNLNSDLMTAVEYPPSDAEKIAHHCAVIREMRDTRGDIDQSTWYRAIGVLAFTEQGESVCQEWSDGHPSYDRAETSGKFSQAKRFAPTTCEKLEECRPDLCGGCPFKGQIKSPIMLGTPNGAPQPVPVSMLPDEESSGTFVHDLPSGFGWGACGNDNKEHGLYRVQFKKAEDDNGNEVWVEEKNRFSDVLFYPINRVRASDGTFTMNMFMKDKHGNGTKFILDHGAIAEGGKTLFSELGRREIGVQNNNKADVSAYLTAWIGKLRDEYASSPAVDQFGWMDDSFVIGDTVYVPGGTKRAILTKGTYKRAKWLEPSGDLQTWINLVDRAYNHPGDEPFQFMLLTSLASPLVHLIAPSTGVFVHVYNQEGGEGKSTAQFVGMSAWGQHTNLVIREDEEHSTKNALYMHFGRMNNLPVVIDEMSECSPEFAGRVAFGASSGQGKRTLTSNREERDELGWSTIFSGSSNKMLTEKIASTNSAVKAKMHRIWEYRMPKPRSMTKYEADMLFPQFDTHYGHAGRAFIEYVVNNRDTVKKMAIAMRAMFDKRVGLRQEERYWSNLHACVLTALAICRKIGLLKFDMGALMVWIESELANNRAMVSDAQNNPLEQFGDMLADIFNNILVTVGEGNIAQGSEATVLRHPRGANIAGRSILPTTHTAEKLFVNVNSAKGWCEQHKVSFRDMHKALVAAGWASSQIKRMSLGKGTKEYSGLGGPVKVIELNPSVVRDATGDNFVAQKVTAVIDGGLNGDCAA